MKKQTAEDVENIPVWPINVLVLLISVERNNVYSVRNHIRILKENYFCSNHRKY